ncbi:MAG: hypothetical protein Q9192_006143, partial [Flavoplaca navasiana]
DRDTNLFWPQQWLPSEPGFERARLLSFGYNAHFGSSERKNILNIADFAKELLYEMKFASDGRSQELQIGKVPIIFVAHSMGGLVVKKAHIFGQNDDQYRQIVKSTRAVLFLSTPHRGTDLAELLNRILAVSFVKLSAKYYIAELRQNSGALQDINEQFRNIAPSLNLFSFYETQRTAIGPKKVMVLEKDSSILGYPNEVSKALNADHHNVCKYADRRDPNYISVRNAMKSLLPNSTVTMSCGATATLLRDKTILKNVENLLAVSEAPEDDYEFFRSRWMPGSCQWVFSRPAFTSWLNDMTGSSSILWVNGLPGSGKSVLSSFVIGQLRDMGYSCQYYFFRYADHTKRTSNAMLRSLAYQITVCLPQLRDLLHSMSEEAVKLEKAEARVIWQKVFVSKLCKLRVRQPLYWVIDALDECEAPDQLLSLFSSISTSLIPLRIMVVGRKTDALSICFRRLNHSVRIDDLSTDNTQTDLRHYVEEEIKYLRGDLGMKARVVETVYEKANGIFLWVNLVLKEILRCHTEAEIERALQDMPSDLEPLYQRMDGALYESLRPGDRDLSKVILTWVVYSQRTLTLEEFSEALQPEISSVLDLRFTISHVCGDFVVIDAKGRVGLVHQTAREYLIKTAGHNHSLTLRRGHRELFAKCISYLSRPDQGLTGERPWTFSRVLSTQTFLHYAATAWSYHLRFSAVTSNYSDLLVLKHFFENRYVLGWIQLLAAWNELETLIYASNSLNTYLRKKSKADADSSPHTQRLQDKEFLELWAIDLVKIVGKFGGQLLKHPKIIQCLVPALCPTTTAIFQQLKRNTAGGYVQLNAFARSKWDDCLSRFSIGRDTRPREITCLEPLFAVLSSDGTLRSYDPVTHQLIRELVHGELVSCFKFSPSNEKCVTYGYRTTKIWNVKTGQQICVVNNPENAKALDITFINEESTLMSCSDDRRFRHCVISSPDAGWKVVSGNIKNDEGNGGQLCSPILVAFNTDGSQIALFFRTLPVHVWDIDREQMIGRCIRPTDREKTRQAPYSEVHQLCWNPTSGHVLGLYIDGPVFKWRPGETICQELRTIAFNIQCSLDGSLFVTTKKDGSLEVWNFQHFALVYRLSYHVPIIDAALSPDGSRIYDLRESHCNVWEPNALMRYAEEDEKSSDTTSSVGSSTLVSHTSEVSNENLRPLRTLAVGTRTWLFCSGDDAGGVRLVKAADQTSIEVAQGFFNITRAAWSDDERYLATTDSAWRLRVRTVNDSGPKTEVSLSFETKIGRGPLQVLMDAQSEYLLLVTLDALELWSLGSQTLVTTKPNATPYSRWTTHPSNGAYVIQCSFSTLRLYSWTTLDEIQCRQLKRISAESTEEGVPEHMAWKPLSASFPLGPDENSDAIEDVAISQQGSHLLLQASSLSTPKHRKVQYLMVRLENLTDFPYSPIEAQGLPQAIATNTAKILGFVYKRPERGSYSIVRGVEKVLEESLAFLDHGDWICSWPIGDNVGAMPKIRRHFFLPQDWLNLDSLRLATTSRDGKFFCPRNGEVAIVSDWLQHEWDD